MVKDKAFQDHIYLQPRATYAEVRASITWYLEIKVPVDDAGVAPMDIGYMAKGRGKGSKGG